MACCASDDRCATGKPASVAERATKRTRPSAVRRLAQRKHGHGATFRSWLGRPDDVSEIAAAEVPSYGRRRHKSLPAVADERWARAAQGSTAPDYGPAFSGRRTMPRSTTAPVFDRASRVFRRAPSSAASASTVVHAPAAAADVRACASASSTTSEQSVAAPGVGVGLPESAAEVTGGASGASIGCDRSVIARPVSAYFGRVSARASGAFVSET